MLIQSICNDLIKHMHKELSVHMPISINTQEVFIATKNNNIIGYIIININKDNSYTLEHFHVIEKFRGSGIGQQLLKRCLDEYKKLNLMVNKYNNRAIHIYKKFGFYIDTSKSRSYYIMVKI